MHYRTEKSCVQLLKFLIPYLYLGFTRCVTMEISTLDVIENLLFCILAVFMRCQVCVCMLSFPRLVKFFFLEIVICVKMMVDHETGHLFPFRIMRIIASCLTVVVVGINMYFVINYLQKLPDHWAVYLGVSLLITAYLIFVIYLVSSSAGPQLISCDSE